ncbi:MAG: UDP-N-acetylmuramoyl-L-alanyl-D-glutamate--2,6-diaminopimelate ligase [Candidatus Azotimanducaceae bacterium]|jgi:UDP-N-acetylmuramoyl-L-alanyl-D-glutamate--2,6-diaminopimelate ligase
MQMMLSTLLPELPRHEPIALNGLTDDSRLVKPGDVFLAVSGPNHNVQNSIREAANKSAAAIICEVPVNDEGYGTPIFALPNLASLRSEIAGKFYNCPSDNMLVIAITGTNGKTSCSHFIAQAFENIDRRCGVVGTLGSGTLDHLTRIGLTTPSAVSLQEILNELKRNDVNTVSIEASSHGLAQNRLSGVKVDTAVFTNLTRDHLDYHGTFDSYKSAKQKLFQMEHLSAAVINIDDEFGRSLAKATAPSIQKWTYSLSNNEADIYVREITYQEIGFDASVHTPWGDLEISSDLFGEFNVSNLLAVIAVLGQQGYQCSSIANAISAIDRVQGRMHRLSGTGNITVIVDYSHTPDALEKALATCRMHAEKKLWCVMGCGGDRDQGKRALMGEVSTRLADETVVTSDNPRYENPESIINDIVKGCDPDESMHVEVNRASAIEYALNHASTGDCILISGKGHEEYQEILGERIEYSDFKVVEDYLSNKSDRGEI